jgi:hypothetical protein
MEQKTGSADDGEVGRELEGAMELELDEIRHRLEDVGQRLTGFIRERPGTSILIALGAGYLVGRLMRS